MALPGSTKKIKNIMRTGTPFTSWDAIQMFRYTRLASLIGKWEEKGAKINHENRVKIDGHFYTAYTLVSEPKNSYKSDLSKLCIR